MIWYDMILYMYTIYIYIYVPESVPNILMGAFLSGCSPAFGQSGAQVPIPVTESEAFEDSMGDTPWGYDGYIIIIYLLMYIYIYTCVYIYIYIYICIYVYIYNHLWSNQRLDYKHSISGHHNGTSHSPHYINTRRKPWFSLWDLHRFGTIQRSSILGGLEWIVSKVSTPIAGTSAPWSLWDRPWNAWRFRAQNLEKTNTPAV